MPPHGDHLGDCQPIIEAMIARHRREILMLRCCHTLADRSRPANLLVSSAALGAASGSAVALDAQRQ
jgi:hypothetical protein